MHFDEYRKEKEYPFHLVSFDTNLKNQSAKCEVQWGSIFKKLSK